MWLPRAARAEIVSTISSGTKVRAGGKRKHWVWFAAHTANSIRVAILQRQPDFAMRPGASRSAAGASILGALPCRCKRFPSTDIRTVIDVSLTVFTDLPLYCLRLLQRSCGLVTKFK
jgi:hypothetical protein